MIRDVFVNIIVIIAFSSLAHQFLLSGAGRTSPPGWRRLYTGLLGGLLGIVLMLFSVRVTPMVILDFRNVAIAASALYGGAMAGIVASALIGGARMLLFGLSYESAVAAGAALAAGVLCAVLAGMRLRMRDRWSLCGMASVLTGGIAFVLLLPDPAVLRTSLITYGTGTALLTVFLCPYLEQLRKIGSRYRRMEQDAGEDHLTGLNNRRRFDLLYGSLLRQATEGGQQVSLLFIDLDNFKDVNDRYGHPEGDRVLREFSRILRGICRSFDIISRNGGDEFSVLLLDCTETRAKDVAERIRTAVEHHPFPLSDGTSIPVTVSIGIASAHAAEESSRQLVHLADSALYHAKHAGRNRISLAGSPAPEAGAAFSPVLEAAVKQVS